MSVFLERVEYLRRTEGLTLTVIAGRYGMHVSTLRERVRTWRKRAKAAA